VKGETKVARIILIKSTGLDNIKRMLERTGHQVVATATDQIGAVRIILDATIEADLFVVGGRLYRAPFDPMWINSSELGGLFERRGLPVVVHSTDLTVALGNWGSWPGELVVFTVGKPYELESLLTTIEQATAKT
jgi:hypothetical protein